MFEIKLAIGLVVAIGLIRLGFAYFRKPKELGMIREMHKRGRTFGTIAHHVNIVHGTSYKADDIIILVNKK